MVESLDLPQQAWLQGLMSHKIVTEERAKAMFKVAVQACEIRFEDPMYDQCYSKVNKAINIVNLEIRRVIDERDGKHLLAIINTKSDEIAQLSTQFTSNEIEYIKRLVGEIFTAPRHAYCVSSNIALGLGREMDPEISSSKSDIICKKLNGQGWLVKESGFYFLAPRALLELQSYLRGLYEEYMHSCIVCKEIVTRGKVCSTSECEFFIHSYCERIRLESLLIKIDGRKCCPTCKQEWKPVEVGDTGNASTMIRRRRRNVGKSNPLGFQSVENGEEEDEEEDEGEEEEEEETTTQSSASKRQRGDSSSAQERSSRRRRVDNDEDENNDDDEETAPLESDEGGEEEEEEEGEEEEDEEEDE